MPLLDDHELAELRIDQGFEARQGRHCPSCMAQIWKNYCREHDEYFDDGHLRSCGKRTRHQGCDRTY